MTMALLTVKRPSTRFDGAHAIVAYNSTVLCSSSTFIYVVKFLLFLFELLPAFVF